MIVPLVLFTLVLCAALLVQSFAGFAGGLIAIPLLSLFLSPSDAVPAYNMVTLVVNLLLVYECRKSIQWHRMRGVLVGGLIGVPIGAYCLKHLPLQWIGVAICTVTMVFAVTIMLNVKVALNGRRHTQLGVGLLSGVLGGSISESGPPVVMYALSQGWNKDAFRSTLLGYFTCLGLMANACYWMYGMVSNQSLLCLAMAVVPAIAVALFGVRLKNFVSEEVFRRAVLCIVVCVSLIGLVRHLHQ